MSYVGAELWQASLNCLYISACWSELMGTLLVLGKGVSVGTARAPGCRMSLTLLMMDPVTLSAL
jgi:hypothetical protein